MSWDDNWTRALVTVLAAAAGAILSALVSAYAARIKIKEIELQYKLQLRDKYINNARAVASQVYIPIGIQLSLLAKSYSQYIAVIDLENEDMKHKKENFVASCLSFVEFLDSLFSRGGDAYLTTPIDESLNEFVSFLRESVRQQRIAVKRIVVSRTLNINTEKTFVGEYKPLPSMYLEIIGLYNVLGLSFGIDDRLLSAPVDSKQFEDKFRGDVTRIKGMIKSVILGSGSDTPP